MADIRVLEETDICIVGAGPVGQTIARAFVDCPVQVSVLESGTLDAAPSPQDLSASHLRSAVRPADALAQGRHRGFGGTSALWLYATGTEPRRPEQLAARAVLPEEVDFERRRGRAGLGWPLSMSDLEQDYAEALRLWTGARSFAPAAFADAGRGPLEVSGGALETRLAHHGARAVWTYHADHPLVRAPNVTIHESTTALRIEGDAATGRIDRVVAARADGEVVAIRAGVVVLAGGGVENAQLLLSSELTVPAGRGNRFDHVGRHLTDHPEFRLGMIPADPDTIARLGFYDVRRSGSQLVSGFLTLSEDLKRAEGLLNLSVALTPFPAGHGTPADRALRALWAVRHGAPPRGVLRQVGALVHAPREALSAVQHRRAPYAEFQGGWCAPDADLSQLRQIELWAVPEQSPDPGNALRLGSRRDRFGRARVEARWSWSKADRANVRRSCALVADALRSAGLGTLRPWGTLDDSGPVPGELRGLHHPMGTTRMSADPRDGAVDLDLRVHGLDNVYVAGSSVFPSGHGYANPTLTALALAVRLGDHLRARLGVAQPEPLAQPEPARVRAEEAR